MARRIAVVAVSGVILGVAVALLSYLVGVSDVAAGLSCGVMAAVPTCILVVAAAARRER